MQDNSNQFKCVPNSQFVCIKPIKPNFKPIELGKKLSFDTILFYETPKKQYLKKKTLIPIPLYVNTLGPGYPFFSPDQSILHASFVKNLDLFFCRKQTISIPLLIIRSISKPYSVICNCEQGFLNWSIWLHEVSTGPV